MQIKNIVVGPLQTNCYIIFNDSTCIVIDPGDEYNKIRREIGNKKLEFVILTHSHNDHKGALKQLIDEFKVITYDITNLEEKKYNIKNFKFEIIYTKGHTNDSISIYFYENNFMMTGDFLFKETIGRTDLPTGSDLEMKKSLLKIKNYPNMIKIYPGHGLSTILGKEKLNNYFLKN